MPRLQESILSGTRARLTRSRPPMKAVAFGPLLSVEPTPSFRLEQQ
jgi:hypothetical protein